MCGCCLTWHWRWHQNRTLYDYLSSDHKMCSTTPSPPPPQASRRRAAQGWPLGGPCVSGKLKRSVAGLGDCGGGGTPRRTMKLLGFAVGAAGEREARENPEGARGLQGQKNISVALRDLGTGDPPPGMLASVREGGRGGGSRTALASSWRRRGIFLPRPSRPSRPPRPPHPPGTFCLVDALDLCVEEPSDESDVVLPGPGQPPLAARGHHREHPAQRGQAASPQRRSSPPCHAPPPPPCPTPPPAGGQPPPRLSGRATRAHWGGRGGVSQRCIFFTNQLTLRARLSLPARRRPRQPLPRGGAPPSAPFLLPRRSAGPPCSRPGGRVRRPTLASSRLRWP